MPIQIRCSRCQVSIKVADTLRGKSIRCPSCQQVTKVPGGQTRVAGGNEFMEQGPPRAPRANPRNTRVGAGTERELARTQRREPEDDDRASSRSRRDEAPPRRSRETGSKSAGFWVATTAVVLVLMAGASAATYWYARPTTVPQVAASKPASDEEAAKKIARQKKEIDSLNKKIADDAARKAAENDTPRDDLAAKKKTDDDVAAAAAKKKTDDDLAVAAAKKKTDDDLAVAAAKKKSDDDLAVAAAKKKSDDDLAAKKTDDDPAAAKKKMDDDLAAKKKMDDDDLLAKKKMDEDVLAKKKMDEDVLAKKKMDEDVLAKKKMDEDVLAKKKMDEDVLAKKKMDEDVLAKKKMDEDVLAKKKMDEDVLAKKKMDEDVLAKKKMDEDVLAKKKMDEDVLAKKKMDEDVLAKKKMDEDVLAKKKMDEDVLAKKKMDEDVLAKKKMDEDVLAKKKMDEDVLAKKKMDDDLLAKKMADDKKTPDVPKVTYQPVPIPPGPAPDNIAVETTKKVKKSTAFIKVTDSTNQKASGSGFFAMEPGIVVTNAHVVGMLAPGEGPPKKLEIVIHSGTKEELTYEGIVLGADRDNDLAIVRLQGGDMSRLPPPLPVELDGCSLTEAQGVLIFGFPYGAQLGKEITVSKSDVSSFRRDDDGSLFQIQVNGGMHPGNSGGPVVDTRGVVVGVSVAGIPGTQINFAVPSEKIQGMLHGRVQETYVGLPFREQKTVKLPVKLTCLDPLQRIRQLSLDVWTGPGGATRPGTLSAPANLPGDGAKKSIVVQYQLGKANHDIELPTLDLPPGHVFWIQPVLVSSTGVKQWAPTTSIKPADLAPLERLPVNLTFSNASSERSLNMVGKFEFQIQNGKKKIIESDDLNFQVLEEMTNESSGAFLRVVMGKGEFTETEGAGESKKTKPRQADAQNLVKRKIFTYSTDLFGKLEKFGFPVFRPSNPSNPKVIVTKGKNPKVITPSQPAYSIEKEIMYMEAENMASMFNTCYQLSSLNVPNRQVKPLEVWDTRIAVLVGTGKGKKTQIDLFLKYTYEGSRIVNGKTEALISVVGEVEKHKTAKDDQKEKDEAAHRPKSKVRGQGTFDVESGFFKKLKVAIVSEGEGSSFILEVNLTREMGNVNKIGPLPPRNGGSGPGPGPTPGTGPSGPVAGDTRVVGGGDRDPVARDQAPAGALLVGFEVGMANRDVVAQIRPIYRSAQGETFGNVHGGAGVMKTVTAKAMDGYAIGAFKAKIGLAMDGFSVTFMRIKDGKLDPSDRYESAWLGGPGGSRFEDVGGGGTPAVGVLARTARGGVVGLGLILKTAGAGPGPAPGKIGPGPGPGKAGPAPGAGAAASQPTAVAGNSALLVKVISGDLFESLQKFVAARHLGFVDVRGNSGTNSSSPLTWQAAAEGGVLIGLQLNATKDTISGVRPIYLTKDGEKLGLWLGLSAGNPVILKAKPGYVVGRLNLRTGINVDGMSIKFVKLDGSRIDVTDNYNSENVGAEGVGSNLNYCGVEGAFYVGCCGHLSLGKDRMVALGLVALAQPIELSGDMYAQIKSAVAENRLADQFAAGRQSKFPYRDVPAEGGILIGFQFAASDRGVQSLRPIFQTAAGEKMGEWVGAPPANPVTAKARPGYVVGRINKARWGHMLEGFSIKFVKFEGGRPDPTDSYMSDWIGGNGGNTSTQDLPDGLFFVGVSGCRDNGPQAGPCSISLVTIDRSKAAGSPPATGQAPAGPAPSGSPAGQQTTAQAPAPSPAPSANGAGPSAQPPATNNQQKTASQEKPQTGSLREFDQATVQAWTGKVDVQVCWMGLKVDLVWARQPDGLEAPVPAFKMTRYNFLTGLPDPGVPFGLDLSLRQVEDAALKGLAGFKSLQSLSLAGSKVTDAGLKDLAGLDNLQALNLSMTGVTDAGMKELAGFKNLQALFLFKTKVTDAGLKELASLKKLQALNLHMTDLTDAGLKNLAGLENLQTLVLVGTKVTDAGLEKLAGLRNLRVLKLSNTKVTDAGLKVLLGFPNLETLELTSTQLTGAGLKNLRGLKKLRSLRLDYTQVTDAGITELAGLTGLQTLNLGHTQVTDGALSQLGSFNTSLQTLDISKTSVTASGVNQLKKALPTCQIITR